jgi:hypothetical protein
MKEKIEEKNNHWENYQKASPLSTLLLFGGFIIGTVAVGILFGITVSAIMILIFSAFFGGYLMEAYTARFEIAKFAKSFAIILFFLGIIMLFISLRWWSIFGIFGYWFLFTSSRSFWQKRLGS